MLLIGIFEQLMPCSIDNFHAVEKNLEDFILPRWMTQLCWNTSITLIIWSSGLNLSPTVQYTCKVWWLAKASKTLWATSYFLFVNIVLIHYDDLFLKLIFCRAVKIEKKFKLHFNKSLLFQRKKVIRITWRFYVTTMLSCYNMKLCTMLLKMTHWLTQHNC